MNKFLKYFIIAILFTLLSGALRKWFISSKQVGNFILFLQILVPFVFILTFNISKPLTRVSKQMAVYIIVLVIGIINPLSLTFYHGILGLLLYAAFPFVIFYYINNREKFTFYSIASFLFYICLAELILGFFQSSQPADSFINTYADVEAVGSIAIVGKAARVTGTFSYISGYTAFLFFLVLIIWALIIFRYKSIYVLILLVLGLIGCFMSGARAATYLYLIVVATVAFVDYRSLKSVLLNIRLFFPLLLIATILFGLGNDNFFDLITNSLTGFLERRARGIESGEENTRIFNDVIEVFNFRGNYPVLGVGIGATYQGATKLFGISPYVLEYGFFESELVRIVLEGGFILLGARIMIIISLVNALLIPKGGKVVLIILFILFFPTIFNVYNATLGAMGLIVVDAAYYQRSKLEHQLYIQKKYS